MADRLQFRGYGTYFIPGQPLADREIMFDTDLDTLVIGKNKTYVLTERTGYTREQIEGLMGDLVQGAQGPQGPDGPQGPAGPQGPQGAQGPQGIQGIRGESGAGVQLSGTINTVGPPSNPGTVEAELIIDSVGDGWIWDGATWNNVGPIRGPQGETGLQGPIGPTGSIGLTGPAGPQGPQGIQGERGLQGPQGLPGTSAEGGGASVSVGTTPPGLSDNGDLWYSTQTARMYVYVDDGDSSQWVQSNPYLAGDAGPGYINGSYNASNGVVTFIGANGNPSFTTGDLRGANGNDGDPGPQGPPGVAGPAGPSWNGGTVTGSTLFQSLMETTAVNVRGNLVTYGYPIIGTGTLEISGNSAVSLQAGGVERLLIDNSIVAIKREARFEVLETTGQAANAFLTSAGRIMKSTSSARYKHGIEDYDADAAYKFLEEARPVTFYSKTEGDDGQYIGFIAEEVEKVEPRYVTRLEDGTPDGVQYASIVATLTKICQLQEERIALLEEKLNGA